MQKGIMFTIILVLAAGIAVGYYFGYDHGWEKAGEESLQKMELGEGNGKIEEANNPVNAIPQEPVMESDTTINEPQIDRELSKADIEEILKRLETWDSRKNEQIALFGGEYRKSAGTYQGREVEEVYVCFGDVCPDNGGFYLRYVDAVDEAACQELSGNPICGYGWTRTCSGCAVRP